MIAMTGFNAMTPNAFLVAIAGTCRCDSCTCMCSTCSTCSCSSCDSCSGNSASVFNSASAMASDIVSFSNSDDGHLALLATATP
jgi:hypothetical protein